MKVLVFGQTGQVATELGRFEGVTCLCRDQADLVRPGACARRIAESDAYAVINAAAYTAVDKAETDDATAQAVNAEAPAAMAQAAAKKGIPFVHISTDYVFDGSGTVPWRPEDTTGPLGVYGQTKLAGETGVRTAGGVHAILRTSWVFSAHGTNFLKTMLHLSKSRDQLSIVADQVGGPTPADAIAETCLALARGLTPETSGIYHFSGAPDTSWAGFAREIFRAAGREMTVTDIPTADYPTPARRPLNSRLNCSGLETAFGIARPDWRAAVARIVRDLI